MKKLFSFLVVLSCSLAAAQDHITGTITSTQCVSVQLSGKTSAIAIQVTGTWTGTLQPQVTIQGNTAANIQVTPSTSSTAQSTITANGVYTATIAGYDTAQVCGNTVASGTATIYLNSSVAGSTASAGGGGSATPAFNTLTSGTNTGAAMVVGSGASLATSGTGTIAATSLTGNATGSLKLNCVQTSIQGGDTRTSTGNFATTCSIPANTFIVGDVLEIWAAGIETVVSGDNHKYGVKIGSTQLIPDSGASGSVVSNVGWSLQARVICNTTGASGAFEAQGNINQQNWSNANIGAMVGNTATITIDTTASQTLAIDAGGTIGAGGSGVMRQFIARIQRQ